MIGYVSSKYVCTSEDEFAWLCFFFFLPHAGTVRLDLIAGFRVVIFSY